MSGQFLVATIPVFTTTLFDFATAAAEFAVNWLLQSTLLITLGLLAGALLRKRGSAAQSVVYRTTLVAVLICPLATWLLAQSGVSGWSLELPAAWAIEESLVTTKNENSTIIALKTQTPSSSLTINESERNAPFTVPSPPSVDMAITIPADAIDEPLRLPPAAEPLPISPETPLIATVVPTNLRPNRVLYSPFGYVTTALVAAYILVSSALLLRLGLAWWELARLRHRTISADATTIAICRALAPQLRVRPPTVLRSPYIQSPCLAGLWHAVVLLPEAQIELPIRDVLIHELAHLRRHDCHWKLLHKLASALFFFQPLVWKLARRIDATSEEVCDDYVMQLGGDRQQYAHGLVDVAELSAAPTAAVGAVGVGIVSLRSMLAHRVARIMDTSRTLSTRVGSVLVMLVVLGGIIGTGLVGLVGLKPRPSLAETPATVEVADANATDNSSNGTLNESPRADDADAAVSFPPIEEAPTTAATPNTKVAAPAKEIFGRVFDADEKPVAGAQFYWFRTRVHDIDPMSPRLIATTNDKGEFKFTPPPMDISEDEPAGWGFRDQIVVKAPGHGFKVTSPSELRRRPLESWFEHFAGALVRLPAAGEPIEGRLINIEGQPIVGAKVRTRWFNDSDDRGHSQPGPATDDKAGRWNQRVNYLLNVIEPAPLREVLPQAVTDAEGRFTLTDIGADRLLQLLVEGQGIETTEIIAHNESAEALEIPAESQGDRREKTAYGRQFVRAIGPSRPIEGRVLDFDTNEPLAGAVVRAMMIHGINLSSSREREEFATRTDAAGRYRITGLPIGDRNQLVAFTTGDAPYVPIGHDVDTSKGKESTQQDFRLKQGLWVKGRVFDPETNKTYTGEISYYFFLNPELKAAIPGIYKGDVDGRYYTNSKGEFRIPVLHAPGVLAYRYEAAGFDRSGIDRFPRGSGEDQITAKKESFGAFATAPSYLMPGNYERVLEIRPTADQTELTADMPLIACPPIKVRVVDADGKPINKYILHGASERWGWQPQTSADVTVTDLKPNEKRKLFAFDRDRNLAGFATVTYGEKETVLISLQKGGSIVGTIVDPDQNPRANVTLIPNLEKLRGQNDVGMWASVLNQSVQPTDVAVDKQGRFRLDGIVPGLKYNAHASATRRNNNGQMDSIIIGAALTDVVVAPGEVKDLGLIVVGKRDDDTSESKAAASESEPTTAKATIINPPAVESPETKKVSESPAAQLKTAPATVAFAGAPAAKPPAKDFKLNYRGQVVDPQGQPVAGAKIYRVYWRHTGETSDAVPASAVTNANGKFEFNLNSADLEDSQGLTAQLVAAAPGYGVAIGSSLDFETTGEALAQIPEPRRSQIRERQAKHRSDTLKLVADDAPITGQVVSTEGRPIAGARMRVKDVWTNDAGNLDDFEKAAHQPKADFYSLRRHITSGVNGPQLPSIIADAVTDADGRFKLTGIGRERVVELRISGPGVETMLVRARTRQGEKIVVPHQWRPGEKDMPNETFLPSSFVHVAGLSHPVTGRVVDADSGQPIAGMLVSAGQWGSSFSTGKPHLVTRSDADGTFRLEGIPLGREEQIFVQPSAGSLYLPTAKRVTLNLEQAPAAIDFRLKRGVPVRGQAVDQRNGQPIIGHVGYYAFDDNTHLRSFPGFSSGFAHERRTDNQGRFEIPVIPGRGVLTFSPDDHQRYRRGVGTESIKGLTDQSGVDLKVFRTVPSRLISINKHLLRGLDIPSDGSKVDDLKLELDAGVVVPGKLFDADRKPLTSVVASGATYGGGWYEYKDDSFAVQGYYPDAAPRDLFFYQPERNLAGYFQLKGEAKPPIEVVLQPAGAVRGRVLDNEGAPITGLELTGAGVPAGFYLNESLKLSTDKQGRFEIRGLIPGRKYTLIGSLGVNRNRVGDEFSVLAGETMDLGDVKLSPLDQAMAATPAAATKEKDGNIVLAKSDEKKASPAASESQTTLRTLRGRVVDANDKPIRGAHVAAAAAQIKREVGGSMSLHDVTLAEIDSDERGEFALQFAQISDKTHFQPSVLARAEGHGLGWAKIDFVPKTADGKPEEFAIKLLPEESIRARLIDIDGQPCAGVRCTLKSLVPKHKQGETRSAESINLSFAKSTPAAWLSSVTSDQDGRIVLHGIPPGFGAYLTIEGSEQLAPQDITLNTGASEQREERDGTYRPLVKNAPAGEEAAVALAPAQWFEGVVRYEDTGKPAPHARLKIWASQQRFGSMISIDGKADEQGRYRLNPPPGVRFGVTAFPPAGAPYLTRQTPLNNPILWENGDRVKQLDLTLKRGITLRGAVVDAVSGEPIAGASIQYIPESDNNPNVSEDILTGREGIQTSDEQGEFQIVALPGLGRLLVHDADGRHVLQEIGSNDLYKSKPGGIRNFAHAIQKVDLATDKEPEPLKIALQPGATVKGRILDPQGVLVPEAFVISPLNIRAFWLTWHGHTDPTLGGNFEINGLGPDEEQLFYFLDVKRRLGAARSIKATDQPLDVKLEQCGEARARFVDPEGKPVKGHHPPLHIVIKPGVSQYDGAAHRNGALAAAGDFVSNVDRTNHPMSPDFGGTDADGRVVFPALIPGATYQLLDYKDGTIVVGREFKVASNELLDLGEITLVKP